MFRLVTRSSSITHEGQRLTVAFTDETGKKLLSLWSPADDSPWRLGFAWSGETLMDAVERAVLGVGYVTLELIPEAASEGLPGTIHVDFRHAEGASANEVHQTLAEILGDLATTER